MTGEHIRGIPRTYEKEITIADTPYTLSLGYNCVKVDTTGGNVRVNLPDVNYPIDVIKTSSDAYIVTVWVGGVQKATVAGELSKITIENAEVIADEPLYPYDVIVGIAGVSGDGGEVIAKDRFGRVIARGVAGTDDVSVIHTAIAATPSSGLLKLLGDFVTPTTITVGSYITIDMHGATFTNTGNTGACIEIFHSGTYARDTNLLGGKIIGGAVGIIENSIKDCSLADIKIRNCGVGLDVTGGSSGTWFNTHKNITITGCTSKGLHLRDGVGRQTVFVLVGGRICSNENGIYNESTGTGNAFYGVDIEGNTTYDVYNGVGGYLEFFGCKMENSLRDSLINDGSTFNIWGGRQTGAYYGGSNEYAIVKGNMKKINPNVYHAKYYPSLQACIDAAPNGSTVCLDRGTTYAENVVVTSRKDLLITGVGNLGSTSKSTIAPTTGDGIKFDSSNNIKLSNVEIAVEESARCIAVAGTSTSMFFNDLSLLSGLYGIYLYASGVCPGGFIRNCIFKTYVGIETTASNDAGGISIYDISNNSFTCTTGMYLKRIKRCFVTKNYFNCTTWLRLGFLAAAEYNLIYENQIAAGVLDGALNTNKLYRNVGCPTDASGSDTGTGSEQTIAHGLSAIPTGCKAWIKYLVGARYVTEMIPFDATNVYPTVDNGVAYEWRIE